MSLPPGPPACPVSCFNVSHSCAHFIASCCFVVEHSRDTGLGAGLGSHRMEHLPGNFQRRGQMPLILVTMKWDDSSGGGQLTKSRLFEWEPLAFSATFAACELLLLLSLLRRCPHGGSRKPCLQCAAQIPIAILHSAKCPQIPHPVPCLPVSSPVSTYGSILGRKEPRIAFSVCPGSEQFQPLLGCSSGSQAFPLPR